MRSIEQIEYIPFEAKVHLPGVLRLCEAEEWETFASDPGLTLTALSAPGVTTVVATWEGEVVGFAHMQGDGVWQAHLSLLAVEESHRGRGIGRALVEEAFERCGGERVDLIANVGAEGFYESFPHKTLSGYRIYPNAERETA